MTKMNSASEPELSGVEKWGSPVPVLPSALPYFSHFPVVEDMDALWIRPEGTDEFHSLLLAWFYQSLDSVCLS